MRLRLGWLFAWDRAGSAPEVRPLWHVLVRKARLMTAPGVRRTGARSAAAVSLTSVDREMNAKGATRGAPNKPRGDAEPPRVLQPHRNIINGINPTRSSASVSAAPRIYGSVPRQTGHY